MGQITLFPRSRLQSESKTPVEHVFVVGVADELDRERAVPSELVRLSPATALRYTANWELEAARATAHLLIEAISPSRADRRVVAETVSGEVIEQDRNGAMLVNGEVLGGGALVSFCALPSQTEQRLELGQQAGWLVAERCDDAFVFSVHTSAPLLWIFALPRALGVLGTFSGWTVAATHLIPAPARHREEWAVGDHRAQFDPDRIAAASGGEVTGA